VPDLNTTPTPPTRSVGGVGRLTHTKRKAAEGLVV
jgi:hypothetical protein